MNAGPCTAIGPRSTAVSNTWEHERHGGPHSREPSTYLLLGYARLVAGNVFDDRDQLIRQIDHEGIRTDLRRPEAFGPRGDVTCRTIFRENEPRCCVTTSPKSAIEPIIEVRTSKKPTSVRTVNGTTTPASTASSIPLASRDTSLNNPISDRWRTRQRPFEPTERSSHNAWVATHPPELRRAGEVVPETNEGQ